MPNKHRGEITACLGGRTVFYRLALTDRRRVVATMTPVTMGFDTLLFIRGGMTCPGNGLMIRKAIEIASPGDVLVVNSYGSLQRAVIGGNVLISMAAAFINASRRVFNRWRVSGVSGK